MGDLILTHLEKLVAWIVKFNSRHQETSVASGSVNMMCRNCSKWNERSNTCFGSPVLRELKGETARHRSLEKSVYMVVRG